MGVIKTSDAAQLLEQWGLWAWTAPDKLGYASPMLQILKDNVERKDRRYMLMISDDAAMVVDEAVTLLAKLQPQVARIVVLHCLYRQDYVDIAEREKCSRKMVANLFDQGAMWVDGHLAASEKYLAAS